MTERETHTDKRMGLKYRKLYHERDISKWREKA